MHWSEPHILSLLPHGGGGGMQVNKALHTCTYAPCAMGQFLTAPVLPKFRYCGVDFCHYGASRCPHSCSLFNSA